MEESKNVRYSTYRDLMTNPAHWQKTLGIISCKIIREQHVHKRVFNKLIDNLMDEKFRDLVKDHDWRLALTGGTFEDLPEYIKGLPEYKGRLYGLAPSALGIIQIANLVVYGHLFAVAFYNHMEDLYADSPQNLCLRRICNYFDTPLFEDATSIDYIVKAWEAGGSKLTTRADPYDQSKIHEYYAEDSVLFARDLEGSDRHDRARETLAIVSHDDRKMTMLNFCLEHTSQILEYRRVISTGTTGQSLLQQLSVMLEVFGDRFNAEDINKWGWNQDAEAPKDFLKRKIQPFASGPKGGDVQISAKVIDGTCHRVLFFQDPEKAHAHQFDIRLMEKAVQDPLTAALFATSEKTARMMI